MQAKVGRWGRNLAVRVPGEIAERSGLAEGQCVDISVRGGDVVIRPIEAKLTLEDMFRGQSTEEWRALYADHFDWGPDVGREIIDD